jgi:hypothetical protein
MIQTNTNSGATTLMMQDDHQAERAAELRERAQALLESLHIAQKTCDLHLQRSNRTDPMREVTGRSSFDQAIASAKRAIDVLDRATARKGS